MKIDSDNNLQRFQTGSEAGEAVEIHDFQIVSKFVLVLTLPPPPIPRAQLRPSVCLAK